ncbi:MAG TPA: hypothetical protein VF278_19470 [Pirellulales bacterium]
MLYKTIVLELLEDRTELYQQLKNTRMLRSTMESLAMELKSLHLSWRETLSQARPGSDPSQISSEAMELALKNLEDCLPSVSPPSADPELSIDAAMAYIKSPTSKE